MLTPCKLHFWRLADNICGGMREAGHIWVWSRENLTLLHANNKGANQPGHLGSLISTFDIHCQSSMVSFVYLHKTATLKRQKIGFQDQQPLNAGQALQNAPRGAGQKYCRMLQREHSAILLTFLMLPFVIKIFVWSIFERPFYTGFTIHANFRILASPGCSAGWFISFLVRNPEDRFFLDKTHIKHANIVGSCSYTCLYCCRIGI